ncbi:hypothetical protein [Streptomyces sp. CBMA29]|uniref:hypothetical protein n=1 Tax=Streptomyces sp. CBMA29 TaxID=1896314 RepID=UPI0016618B69|nr:hypothetical protein [Streptomyces sp. CBMA29]MBD0739865.1 hypothetical protein [Streptomyces sp. CBMA29]
MEDGFEELIKGLNEDFNDALMQQRAAAAVLVGQVAGIVYVQAIANGVPADLAKAFAAEYWALEMTPVTFVADDEEED